MCRPVRLSPASHRRLAFLGVGVADWFKFFNDGLDEPRFQYAISEHSQVTSVWLVILSEASKKRSATITWRDDDFELIGYARKINVSVPILNSCVVLLEKIGYITRTNGKLTIPGWKMLQSAYARGVDRGYYDKKKTNKTLVSNSLDSTVRGEERRGEEIRIEKREKSASLPSSVLEEVFNSWNKLSPLPQCLVVSTKRRSQIEMRLRDKFFATNWREAMQKIHASPFCNGVNDRGWKATFDWFLQPDSCLKVMEGKYANNGSTPNKPNPRNIGIVRGPTDYATAKPRLQREREAEAARLAGQVAGPENNPLPTVGG